MILKPQHLRLLYLFAGIVMGVILALSVASAQAQYKYERFTFVEEDDPSNFFYVIWDDVEKVNCYINTRGGISCVRSKNF